MVCHLCGSDKTETLYKLFMTGLTSPPHDENRLLHPRKAGFHIVRFHGKKEEFDIISCTGCGLTRISPFPAEKEIKDIYGDSYYDSWGNLEETGPGLRKIKLKTFRHRLEEIEKKAEKGRILDIGCAAGFFLEAAIERGWNGYGVELSSFSAGIAQKKYGDKVINGTVLEADYQDEFFNAVSLSDLIEHVPSPRKLLKESRRILAKNGILAITTPSTESFTAKIMLRHWTHFKKEHLYYFSPSTISRLLKEEGFGEICIKPAPKALNISYLETQFEFYKTPVLAKTVSMLAAWLPKAVKNLPFMILSGEIFVTARKVMD